MSSRGRVWWAAAAAVTVALAGCGGGGGTDHAAHVRHVVARAGTSDSATPASAGANAAVSVPFANAGAARDTLLQAARSASYPSDTTDGYATAAAVVHAWQAAVPGVQLSSQLTAPTPSQVSAYSTFVTDKVSGDTVLWFTVTDTSNHCAAGAVALSASAGPHDRPTIFVPVDATHLSSCSANALVDVGMPGSTH